MEINLIFINERKNVQFIFDSWIELLLDLEYYFYFTCILGENNVTLSIYNRLKTN